MHVKSLLTRSFLEVLVASFLSIGHTHEDIDQAFIATSSLLRTIKTVTMQELRIVLGKAYNEYTSVDYYFGVANWSEFCEAENCMRKANSEFTKYR